jgi:peptide/nickel transport system substrate-binding protein
MEALFIRVLAFQGWVRPRLCGRTPTACAARKVSGCDRQVGRSKRTYTFSCSATVVALLTVLATFGTARAQTPLVEPPLFVDAVKAGKLPPVEKRMPTEPAIVNFDGTDKTPGRHGGTMTQLMERSSDIKRMSAYGYARLVGYTPRYRIEADILKSFEVRDGREFTFTLRKGHRWSDGQPFTTEDFRYFWQDMVLNKEMSPEGPPKEMLVEGRPPVVTIIDPQTIRYTWDKANPFFLPALAGATPLVIYRPAHYLKRFHKHYVNHTKLDELIRQRNRRDWVDLHFNRDRTARLDNPDVPVLDPWVNTTPSPSERYIFQRNPYYHRVDAAGLQLPYVDRIAVTIAASKLIPAKVGAGEVELQSRALQFNNYTVLKRAEARQNYKVRLWRNARGSQIALYPNLNVGDEVWRDLVRDVRFRRALSLAIDRREINMVIYFGLARESANTLMSESPLFTPDLPKSWSTFDLAQANRLLDELGLVRRDSRGIRLMRDGRPVEIIVETAGEGAEHSDVLELVRDTWAKAGVALFIKPQTRDIMSRRVKAGLAVMSVFFGLDNGIANADTPPNELAPTLETQLQWPLWGMWHVSSGASGAKPDLPAAQRLAELYEAWLTSRDHEQRRQIWEQMLHINADEVFSIGMVNAVPQPVVISNRLRNVPETALYAWEPGGQFGVYRPDTFWLADPKQGS